MMDSHDSTETADLADQGADDGRQPLSVPFVTTVAVVAVIAALGLVAIFAGGPATDDRLSGAADTELLAFGFTTVDGSTSSLDDFVGQPLVVNFFASWCAPCRAELPDLEQVHVNREGSVLFLGVNHDLDESTWRSFVNETEITFETVFQPNTEIFTHLEANGMPSTAFITADGVVRHVHTGLLTDDRLEELIDEHLETT